MKDWVSPAAVKERAVVAGVAVSEEVAESLAGYLRLLFRWNERMNLSALGPGREAVDRLVVEPLVAAGEVPGTEGARVLDIGSGGGSPAIPLRIVRQDLVLELVESRSRKAAFLREAVRVLGLTGTSVVCGRFEELGRRGTVECVTVRGVRLSRRAVEVLAGLVEPGGRLLAFGAENSVIPAGDGWEPVRRVPLVGDSGSWLRVFVRR